MLVPFYINGARNLNIPCMRAIGNIGFASFFVTS